MKKLTVLGSMILGLGIVLSSNTSWAHCEIPCGIYDDQAKINEIHQHIETIEKSMMQIKKISAEGEKNYNQLIRWVSNKEKHAEEIQDIVHQYFMTQRIKPKDTDDKLSHAKYTKELVLLHNMLIYAMKSKQTINMAHTQTLHKLLNEFQNSYFKTPLDTKGSMKGSAKK